MAVVSGLSELAGYVSALSNGMRVAPEHEKVRYRDHLVAAALLLGSLWTDNAVETKRLITEERRFFGWDFLTGESGSLAESAFARLATFIEGQSKA
jgi:hypothetical protein